MAEESVDIARESSIPAPEIHVYAKKGKVEVPTKNGSRISEDDFRQVKSLLELDAKGDNFPDHPSRRQYRDTLSPADREDFEQNQFRRNFLYHAAELYQDIGYDLGGAEPVERLDELVNHIKNDVSEPSSTISEVGQPLVDKLHSLNEDQLSLLIDPKLTQPKREEGELRSRSLYGHEIADMIGPELESLRTELLKKLRGQELSHLNEEQLKQMSDKEFGNVLLSEGERLGNILKGMSPQGEKSINYEHIQDDPEGETADQKKLKIISQFERVAVSILNRVGDPDSKELIGVHYETEKKEYEGKHRKEDYQPGHLAQEPEREDELKAA